MINDQLRFASYVCPHCFERHNYQIKTSPQGRLRVFTATMEPNLENVPNLFFNHFQIFFLLIFLIFANNYLHFLISKMNIFQAFLNVAGHYSFCWNCWQFFCTFPKSFWTPCLSRASVFATPSSAVTALLLWIPGVWWSSLLIYWWWWERS